MPFSGLSRRDILAAPALMQRAAKRRPNFLFILADDHAGYVLGADGNKLASTPNLDKLASEGTRFSRHFCNSPVCTPSRQSFFTGQMPHAAGVTTLQTPLDPAKTTLAKQFKKAGYTTGVFGKMHFNRAAAPGLHGFDVMVTEGELNKRWMAEVKPSPLPEGERFKPRWQPFRDPARIWLNAEKLPYPRHDGEMRSDFSVRLASQFLDANKDKPFALWMSFQEPHSPYDFPREDRTKFDPKRFEVPRVGPEDAAQIPLIFRNLSDDEKRGIIASYYTSVAYLDRNIGKVLAKLRELRLEDDTYIVYMADHGYSLGQHGRFEKHCGYDPALHVPLIMKFPGRVRQGVVNELTEHIDVPATIVDLMGLDPLPVQHGTSLRPYLEGKKAEPRDHIFSEYLINEEAFIRTKRWKYIYCTGRVKRWDGYETDNPTPGRYDRLYDLQADPGEFTDIAKKHAPVVAQMKSLLVERFRATHPEVQNEPSLDGVKGALDFYLRPRDRQNAAAL